ncbi:MAG: HYR domain-containing protein [Bacteroidales bacterium]
MKTKILHKFIGSLFVLLLSCLTVLGQTNVANYTFNDATCGGAIAPPLAGVTATISSTSCGGCTINTTDGTATGGLAYIANGDDNHCYESCPQFFSTEDVVFNLNGAALAALSNFGVYFQARTSATVFTQITVEWWNPAIPGWDDAANFTLTNTWSEYQVTFPIPVGYNNIDFRFSGFSGVFVTRHFFIDNLQVQGDAAPPLPPGFGLANAGDDQNQCFASTINLQGNNPVMPVGWTATVGWTCVSSAPALPGGVSLPSVSPGTTSGAIATIDPLLTPWDNDYVYRFIYTIVYDDGGGTTYTTWDDIFVQDWRLPDAPYGGTTGVELCIDNSLTPFTRDMNGTDVSYGEGMWTQAPTNPVGGASISDLNDAQSPVQFSLPGNYKFYWNTYNPNTTFGICGPNGPDIVEIDVWQDVTAEAGGNQEVCWAQTSATMAASYTGDPTNTEWQTTGTGTFDNEFSATAVYSFSAADIAWLHTPGNVITLTWSVQGHIPPCGEASDFMTLTLENDPPVFTGDPYSGGNLNLNADCEVEIPDATLLVTVADAAPCTGLVTLTQSPLAGTFQAAADEDPIVVVVTATDDAGNSSTADVNYVAQDITPPTWTTAAGDGDVTLECDDATGLSTALAWEPVADDNCSAVTVVEISNVSTQGADPDVCDYYSYTITRHFQANDAATPPNYTVTPADDYVQVITIIDTMKPVLTAGSIDPCYDDEATAEAAAIAATTVTDDCDADPTVTASTVGDCAAVITVKVEDACGNIREITYNTRIDNTPPTIVLGTIAPCYLTAAEAEDAAEAAAKVGTTDNCSAVDDMTFVAVATPDPDPLIGWCYTTVTLTVTDECGKSSVDYYYTRVDNTPPTIVPDEVNVAACFTSMADAYTSILANTTATDNCTADPFLAANRWIEKVDLDGCNFELTIYYVDEFCGNESNYTYTRRVDSIAPVFAGLPTTPITVDCDAIPTPATPTASDNCMGDVSASITLVEASTQDPDPYECGHYNYVITRTWKANDGCTALPANEVVFVQTINVQDTIKPVWDVFPADYTITDGCPYVEPDFPPSGEPSATDRCATGYLYVGYNGQDTVQMGCPHTYALVRQWVAIDPCGNYINGFQHIFFVDENAPDLTTGTIDDCYEFQADAVADALAATSATDECTAVGDIVWDVVTVGTCEAEITVTATDECDNSTSYVYYTIIDNEDPVILCPPDVNGDCANDVPAVATTITEFQGQGGNINDNCSGFTTYTLAHIGDNTIPGGCVNKFVIERTYRITDCSGNWAECTQTITINDDVKPSITCPANEAVDCAEDVPAYATNYAEFVLAGGFASDNCVEPVTVEWVSDDISNQECDHQYVITRTYKVTDVCDNEETCEQTITVFDDVKPLISCPAGFEVECDEDVPAPYADYTEFVAAGGSASDNCVGQVTVSWISDDITNEVCDHQYVITRTYRAFDVCGNFEDCTQTITVNDDVKPLISCPSNDEVACASLVPDHATNYTEFVAIGGTASDNCVGDVTITWEGDVISGQLCPNQYTITRTYMATDVCGNSETCDQTIIVNDDIKPTFTSPVDQDICSLSTGEPYGLFDDPSVVAPTNIDDNCDGPVTFSFTINGGTPVDGLITETTEFPIGINTVVYYAEDDCGNIQDHSFIVEVTEYQQAYAGPSQDWCNGANVYLLGNFPNPGYTPTWSVVSALTVPPSPDPVIFQVGNEAVADYLIPGVTYTFMYELENGPCYSWDTLVVTNWAPPTPSLAGFDQILCNVTTFTMEGNVPTVGDGTWMQISGPICTFTDIHNPAMVVTAATAGEYGFVWSIANGVCQPEVDEVLITIHPPVTISAGPNDEICPNTPSYTVTGSSGMNYDHLFWSAAGTGYFDDVTALHPTYYPGVDDVNAGFVKLIVSAYGLGVCPSDISEMTLLIRDIIDPVISNVEGSLDETIDLDENCQFILPDYTSLINVTDDCADVSEIVITQSPPADALIGSSHNGITNVIITAADLVGNTTTFLVVVTNEDNIAPVITNCEALSQNLPLEEGCVIIMPDLRTQVEITENCGPIVIDQTIAAGTPVFLQHLETVTVLITVTDANPANGTATCLVTLTAIDNTPPTITPDSPDPIAVNMDAYPASCTLTIPNLMGSAIVDPDDNGCNFTLSQNPAIGTVVPVVHNMIIPVSVTVTDNAGHQATCIVNIKATDANAPTVATPTASFFVDTEEDLCSAVVTYVAPTFFDNCTYNVAMTQGLASGSVFPKGTTTVAFTATDAAGNYVTSTFTVTVVDEQDPTIECPGDIEVFVDPGVCGAEVTFDTPEGWDNCPDWVVTQELGFISGSVFPVGTTTVMFQVEDESGNTEQCSFDVTVIDNEGPVVECPELIIVPNATGECGTPTVDLTNPPAYDVCGGPVFIEAIEPDYYEYGNNYVTWEVSDLLGNMTYCVQVVEIIDTELPEVDCPDNITVTIPLNATYAIIPNLGQATATDNCWVVNIVNDAPVDNQYAAGFNYVTWTAFDGAFNEGTCVQTIYVINPNYPAITCPGDVVVGTDLNECGAVVENIDPTEVGGNGTTYTCTLTGATEEETFGGTASGTFFNKGVTTVTYTAYNSYGPPATCSFTVTVNDLQPPTVQCPPTKTVNVDAGLCQATILPSALGNPTLSDNCGGTITWVRTGMPAGNVYPKGNTIIIYTATDAAGNVASCPQTVTVVDNIKPAFTFVPANVTGFCDLGQCSKAGITFPAPATASDNCSGIVTITNTGLIPSGVYPRGVTNIIWTATDVAGNTATALTTVTITDNQMPTINPRPGVGISPLVYTDPGHCYKTISNIDPTGVSDNCSYNLTYTMTGATTLGGTLLLTGNTFQFNKGTTSVTYIVTDVQGNVASITFSVVINDNEKPVITVAQPAITVNVDPGVCYAANVSLGNVTFTDNCGTVTPVITGIPVNGQYPKGVTTITYNVTDVNGNTATPVTQTVTVLDNVPPAFTELPPALVEVNTDITSCTATGVDIGIANAYDICDGEIYVTNDAPAAFPLGNTTVSWTATDIAGNQVTITTTVTVTDNVDPVISACAADKTVAANHPASGGNPAYYGPITQSWLGVPEVTDNCGIASVVANIPFSGNFPVGTTTVTWIITDNSGNTATCEQSVTVTGYIPPVNQITGRMTYGNDIASPMNNSVVTLVQDNDVVATTTTDDNGDFIFTDIDAGTYQVSGDVTKPWGGGNATDALMILRHFTQMEVLYNLPKYAADVNGNGYINSLDALLVSKRFIQSINEFPAGDWVTDNMSVTVNGNTNADFLALCFGDVNGSYVPPTVKIPATVNLNNSGMIYINSFEEFELPVKVASELTTGAVSMVINYPANLFEVTNVMMADPNMMYTVNNGTIRLAWYTTDKLTLSTNEALVTLKLKAKDLSHVTSEVALTLDGVSEIADETGRVLQVDLTMPKLSLATQQASVNVYPNPFQNRTEFSYTLPEQANVNIRVYDMLGNEVSTLVNETQNANTYQITFDASKLLPGVYTYRVSFSNNNGEEIRTGRMVITK